MPLSVPYRVAVTLYIPWIWEACVGVNTYAVVGAVSAYWSYNWSSTPQCVSYVKHALVLIVILLSVEEFILLLHPGYRITQFNE